ncbi:endolytic transglycosylase MltG [Brachybacterium huguangmaarense]
MNDDDVLADGPVGPDRAPRRPAAHGRRRAALPSDAAPAPRDDDAVLDGFADDDSIDRDHELLADETVDAHHEEPEVREGGIGEIHDLADEHDEYEAHDVERAHRSSLRTILPALLVIVVLLGVGVGGYMGYRWLTSASSSSQDEASEFPGPGGDPVTIEVSPGDTGGDIASTLVDAGVIKSSGPFTTAFAANPDAATISPGTYTLKKEMTSSDALTLLLDPASRAGTRVTIPEGMRMSAIFQRLSDATGVPVADFEAAAQDYRALGVPENPANSAEGYLWPGTYDFKEDATATDILSAMAAQMQTELTERGVAPEDQHRILTIASIEQKEARSSDDFGKVARTIDNRLQGVGEAGGRPMNLQLDSTVAYFSNIESISTTNAQRQTDSPYNTYLHPGLPIGPISNPGGAAIDAAINPPEGPWLYWVTVNTDTGETKFATTKAEHDANVQQWKEWARTRG